MTSDLFNSYFLFKFLSFGDCFYSTLSILLLRENSIVTGLEDIEYCSSLGLAHVLGKIFPNILKDAISLL